jgi:P27 family predicted phage terminase small subunit
MLKAHNSMGKRGPKPKSIELKRLEGNPGARPLNEDAPRTVGRATMPKYLKGYASQVWKKIVGSMPEKVYSPADEELLGAYCVAAAMHREAVEHVTENGPTLVSDKGVEYQSPWMGILNTQATKMATIGTRLGLDPAARSTLRVAKEEKVKSKFEGLVAFPGGQSKP